MPILKLTSDDEKRELEFELNYQGGLTVKQRFEMLLSRMREISEIMEKYGHRKPFEIVKRV